MNEGFLSEELRKDSWVSNWVISVSSEILTAVETTLFKEMTQDKTFPKI